MATKTCVFCGFGAKLTGEHVFGDWLTRIGLSREPRLHGAGPLNRSPREIGVSAPFTRTVRDVCGTCNHGWMSRLEAVAGRVLTPLILGRPGAIAESDVAAIAAWVQKTALVGMLVSSESEKRRGYGLPATEYRSLYAVHDELLPLPDTHMWIGRYSGEHRLASIWVTPLVAGINGLPEPELPNAYVMTIIVGEVLLQGVRFTTPMLNFQIVPADGFAQLWPRCASTEWPAGTPVDDEKFVAVSTGRNLEAREAGLAVRPWKPATELPASEADGTLVRLPTPCGQHFVCYPAVLAHDAMRGDFYAFITACECGKTYLANTEADGVHFKIEAEGASIEALLNRYEALPGEETVIRDDAGRFVCKRIEA